MLNRSCVLQEVERDQADRDQRTEDCEGTIPVRPPMLAMKCRCGQQKRQNEFSHGTCHRAAGFVLPMKSLTSWSGWKVGRLEGRLSEKLGAGVLEGRLGRRLIE